MVRSADDSVCAGREGWRGPSSSVLAGFFFSGKAALQRHILRNLKFGPVGLPVLCCLGFLSPKNRKHAVCSQAWTQTVHWAADPMVGSSVTLVRTPHSRRSDLTSKRLLLEFRTFGHMSCTLDCSCPELPVLGCAVGEGGPALFSSPSLIPTFT